MQRIVRKLEAIAEIPAQAIEPLAERFARAMVEDNRKGVLQGQDKDGNPAPPLKYRTGSGKATKARKRLGLTFGTVANPNTVGPSGGFKGLSLVTALPHNNLTTKQYQELTGPRLAPRGENSRSIANYGSLGWSFDGKQLVVETGWAEVLSAKGIPFLRFHFDGLGHNPKYDLAGIREWGKTEIRKSLREWVEALMEAEN